MKPLVILDRLSKNARLSKDCPEARFVDLTSAGSRLEDWMNNREWPESITMPFPHVVFGLDLEGFVKRAISGAVKLKTIKPVIELAFVFNQSEKNIEAFPYTWLRGVGGVGNIEPRLRFSAGQIEPVSEVRNMLWYEQTVLRWVRCCFGFLIEFEAGSIYLAPGQRNSTFLVPHLKRASNG